MIIGDLRFWFAETGRLEEKPDLMLYPAAPGSPGASYADLKLDNFGAPNDSTLECADELVLSRRFIVVSLKMYSMAPSLTEQLVASRYVRNGLVMMPSGAGCTLWGHNPTEVLAEAHRLDQGTSSGWEAADTLVDCEHQPEVGRSETHVVKYILREKDVVDFQEAVATARVDLGVWAGDMVERAKVELAERYRYRQATIAAFALTVGILLGRLLA